MTSGPHAAPLGSDPAAARHVRSRRALPLLRAGARRTSRPRPPGSVIVSSVARLWLAEIAPAMQTAWSRRQDGTLSASEAARLLRLQRPQRRAQFLAGHVLLRRLVAAYAGVAVEDVVIESLADGRPEVRLPAGWRASIAHSHGLVAVLLAGDGVAAGVDIEWMDPQRDIEAIARAACAVAPASREHAYRIWAQHEAELKAGSQGDRVCVATWNEHALAACAPAPPVVELVDVAACGPARPLAIDWSIRPRLPIAEAGDGP